MWSAMVEEDRTGKIEGRGTAEKEVRGGMR